MGNYFLDSSAIIKRYVPEQGQSWIMMLCNPTQGHKIYIAQATLVEVVAGICRRARERSITIDARDRFIDAFRQDSQSAYGIQIVNNAIYTSASDLCKRHKLRAYDAVQLACALRLREKALANRALPPTFVCADNDLITIAAKEGLNVENPNNLLDENPNNHLGV